MRPLTFKDATTMPTVKLSLGPHVIVRHKKNGLARILFAVQNDRPPNWPSTIRLPIDSNLHDLPLNDARLVKAVQEDAKSLREKLERERRGLVVSLYPQGSLASLAEQWENMSNPLWSSLKPRTRRTYSASLTHIIAWSTMLGHPHVKQIKAHMIRAWLESGLFAPGFAMHHRRALSRLLSDAVEQDLIEINPVSQMAKRKALVKAEKAVVSQWTQDDVDTYASEAIAMGWTGGAILVRCLWDSPCRLYDVTLWTRGMIVDRDPIQGAALSYKTSKSDQSKGSIAILSPATMQIIDKTQSLYLVTRPDGVSVYAESRDDDKLSYDFGRLRDRVIAMGGNRLSLRYLRHMSQTDAIKHGATTEQIGVSSTHADEAMLLNRYRQADIETAREVARKRGII